MNFNEILDLEAQVESIFDISVKEEIKGGSSGFPRYVFNIERNGKNLTSSGLDGAYGDFGRTFHYYMPITRSSAGPGAGRTVKGGIVAVFVDAQDLLEVEYTMLTVCNLSFNLAVMEIHNIDDTKSTKKGFVYKEASFLTHPLPFTDNCKAIICRYNELQAQSGEVDPQTGDPKGQMDVIEKFRFDEGSMKK